MVQGDSMNLQRTWNQLRKWQVHRAWMSEGGSSMFLRPIERSPIVWFPCSSVESKGRGSRTLDLSSKLCSIATFEDCKTWCRLATPRIWHDERENRDAQIIVPYHKMGSSHCVWLIACFSGKARRTNTFTLTPLSVQLLEDSVSFHPNIILRDTTFFLAS